MIKFSSTSIVPISRVRKNARRVSFPRGFRQKPKRISILYKSRHIRRWFIRNPWNRPLAVFNYAAIKIQQSVRGYLTRIYFIRGGVHKRNYSLLPHAQSNRFKSNKSRGGNKAQLDKYLSFVEFHKKRAISGGGNSGGRIVSKPPWCEGGYSAWCAVRIQSWWRMIPKRRRFLYRRILVNQIAAIVIQSSWRSLCFRRERVRAAVVAQMSVGNKTNAALSIQMCWRSFCNRRIFRYFSDLICIKLKGAPADLLRVVIPNEVDLLDRGAGVHVRFRLGGSVFPPKVYFKIFTHRPLCDINAFAPRDYSQEKTIDPNMLHNTSTSSSSLLTKSKRGSASSSSSTIRVGTKYFGANITTTVGMDNWYKRDECNAWRPIASQLFEDVLTPPWLRDEPKPKKPDLFHYSRVKRKEDMLVARKRRQCEWMAKAYLMAHGEDITKSKLTNALQQLFTEGNCNNVQNKRSDIDNISDSRGFDVKKFNSSPQQDNLHSFEIDPEYHYYQQQQKQQYHDYDVENKHSHDVIYQGMKNGEEEREKNSKRGQIDKKSGAFDNDDLLKWSMALNLDDYVESWKKAAMSLPSDAPVGGSGKIKY